MHQKGHLLHQKVHPPPDRSVGHRINQRWDSDLRDEPRGPPVASGLLLSTSARPIFPAAPQEKHTHMKKFALLLSLVFVAGVVAVRADEAKPAAKATAAEKAAPAAAKSHDVTAEVVSVDAAKNTITLKGEKENHTAPVEGKAVAALKTVKAGDKVTVTCRDNEKGEHQAVTAIAPAKAAAKN
jgi:hypothetical protein